MDAVDGEPAPPELRLGWECEKWHALPEAGAYLDQDYALMTRIAVLMNVYGVVSHYRNLRGETIHSLTDSQRRLLRQLKDMGVLFRA